jgi:hypothetical protein
MDVNWSIWLGLAFASNLLFLGALVRGLVRMDLIFSSRPRCCHPFGS